MPTPSHTDGNTHSEDDRKIGKYDISGLTHDLKNCIERCSRTHDTHKSVGVQHGLIGEGTTDT